MTFENLVLSDMEPASESTGGYVKTQITVPTPRVSDLVGMEQSLKICIASKLPDAAAAPGTLLSELLAALDE